jgi:hypothetical protein
MLFGQRSLRAWVAIEGDPTITGFCERPLVLESSNSRVIDFWVQRANSEEELWFLLRAAEQAADKEVTTPAFRDWSQKQGLMPRLLSPDEPALTDAQFRNWGTVLRYLAANRRLLKDDFINGIREACSGGVQLRMLEQRFQQHDPVLVRTALFHLVHCGRVRGPEFAHALIDPSMRFEPV